MSTLRGATISEDRPDQSGALRANLAKRHMPSLDGLRAIAAFLVVFYHAGVAWSPGGLGVLTFFVLSGFLITWLLLKEEEQSGTISLKSFYIRRSLRIFPAFYAYWFLVSAALLLA
ncbi:MAG TPA: acyltransferase, partial [Bryobacteraceae bacterium]|nr:acyltransferase [Bryobacteraceae bacterium]